MKQSTFSIIVLVLLAGCGYPLRTPPYLDGEMKGIFCPESGNGYACSYVGAPILNDTLPARFDIQVTTWSKTAYTFSGISDLNGTQYTVSGKEESRMTEQHEYLAPQAYLLSGRVTATLTDKDGAVYRLEGDSHYGIGGGFGPDREEPSATFTIFSPEAALCTNDVPCTLGALRFPGN